MDQGRKLWITLGVAVTVAFLAAAGGASSSFGIPHLALLGLAMPAAGLAVAALSTGTRFVAVEGPMPRREIVRTALCVALASLSLVLTLLWLPWAVVVSEEGPVSVPVTFGLIAVLPPLLVIAGLGMLVRRAVGATAE